MGAGESVLQGGAGDAEAGREGAELLELAGSEIVPLFAVHKFTDLGKREAHVAQHENHADLRNRCLVVAAAARVSGNGADEPEIFVVPKRGRRYARSLGQPADAECGVIS